jgi:hypothetical protein
VLLDNGDVTALREAVAAWGFVDEVSALRFALAILARSTDHKVGAYTGGFESIITPAESLLRRPEPPAALE